MKKLFLPALLSICLFTACKKSNNDSGVVIDYYNAYDATYAKLNGSWSVAGASVNTNDPYSSTVVFDHASTVSFTNFNNSTVQTPYSLSLDNNIFYINIKTNYVVKKCQLIKLNADTLQLQSVIGTANAVTINEVFTRD